MIEFKTSCSSRMNHFSLPRFFPLSRLIFSNVCKSPSAFFIIKKYFARWQIYKCIIRRACGGLKWTLSQRLKKRRKKFFFSVLSDWLAIVSLVLSPPLPPFLFFSHVQMAPGNIGSSQSELIRLALQRYTHTVY